VLIRLKNDDHLSEAMIAIVQFRELCANQNRSVIPL
jgi:hypothetical protein